MTDMKDRAREYLRSQTQLNGGGLFHCNVLNLILGFAEQETKKLENENAELQEKLERAERARDYWKSSSFDWRHKCTSSKIFKVAVKAQNQLTKARDIIERYLAIGVGGKITQNYLDVTKDAERFIRKVKNEKIL